MPAVGIVFTAKAGVIVAFLMLKKYYDRLQIRVNKIDPKTLLVLYQKKVKYPGKKLHYSRGYYRWAIEILGYIIDNEDNNEPIRG